MKFVYFLLAVCTAMFANISAHGESAKIKFDNTLHDFELITEDGGRVSHSFAFTNTGDAPLVIIDVTTNCGCTVAKYPQAPIMAGESGTITITFDPKGNPGEFAKEIVVKSNAKKKKTRLHIKGMVAPCK